MNVGEFLAQTFALAIEKTFGNVAEDATQSFVDTGKALLEGLGTDTSGVTDLGSLCSKMAERPPAEAGRMLGGGRGGCGCCGGCCKGGCGKAAANAGDAAAAAAQGASAGGGEGGGEGGAGGAGAGGDTAVAGEAMANAASDSLAGAGEAGEAIANEAANEGKEELSDSMEACKNPPGQDKPAIELGELAQHALVLGDVFMKLFNEHEHDEVKKGGDKSGPPVQKMTCAEHLSHVVFTIKDPWDQPKSPFQEKIISVGKKFLEAPAKGTPKTDEQPAPPPPPSEEEPPSEEQVEPEKPRKKKTLLDSVDKFCKNPGGVIGDAAKGAGVPEEAVDCAQSAINSGIKSAINAGVTAVENTIGIDLPDMDSACEVVGKIKEGKWLGALADVAKQAVKTVLPAVVTGVTAGLVPPAVTTAVLNGVEKVLDMGGSKEDAAACAAAVAEAAGGTPCEGLTALGGIVNSGVVAELVESL